MKTFRETVDDVLKEAYEAWENPTHQIEGSNPDDWEPEGLRARVIDEAGLDISAPRPKEQKSKIKRIG